MAAAKLVLARCDTVYRGLGRKGSEKSFELLQRDLSPYCFTKKARVQ